MIITQSDREFYNKHKDEYTHILSIACPDEQELVKPIHKNHYIVKMWDVDKVLENKFRKYEPPIFTDFDNELYTIVGNWLLCTERNEDFRLLVHCDMGLSRSPAVTLGILWRISSYLFNEKISVGLLRIALEERKQWCKSLLDEQNSVNLRRFIDGRINTGVKPNQAILRELRKNLTYFPW